MSLPVSYTNASVILQTLTAIGSISTLNNSSILLHAGQAEAFINAKIAKKYTLPIVGQVPLLETLATDLAIYNILTTRISLKTDAGEHPWFQRFKNVLRTLNEIADGSLPLVVSDGSLLSDRTDTQEAYSTTMGYKATTFEGSIEYQEIDSNKVEDNLDSRDFDSLLDRLI